MLTPRLHSRSGVTLIELMVTLVVGGLALSLIAAISIREQRITADLADRSATISQLGDASAILPVDLRSLSSIAGDIREARDTSLEIRATIASAVVCDTAGSNIILAPAMDGATTYSSFLNPPAVGDTAWILSRVDTSESWRPHRIDDVRTAPAGSCRPPGPLLTDSALGRARVELRLDTAVAPIIGTPMRITRPLRYSLYRGSDGQWYLGQRDWNTTNLRFNTIQPIAGPFLPPSSGLVFKYVDTGSHPIATPVANTRSIAMIHIDLRAATRGLQRALKSGRSPSRYVDSMGVWLLLRNRR